MSLKSFLNKLWKGIAKVFEGVRAEAKKSVHIAVLVVQGVKKVMDNPVTDVITAIIPGEADDKAKDVIRKWLPKILLELSMVEAVTGIEDPNEQLNAILAKIKLSSDETKNIFYHGLASLIVEKLSDGDFSWSDSVAVAEYYYSHHVKGEAK